VLVVCAGDAPHVARAARAGRRCVARALQRQRARGRLALLVLQDGPVKNVVPLETCARGCVQSSAHTASFLNTLNGGTQRAPMVLSSWVHGMLAKSGVLLTR